MKFELTKEQQMIQKSAADFAKNTLEPIAFDIDRTGEYPSVAIKAMAAHDFMGITIPTEFGGIDTDYLSVALISEAFGKANAAAAAIAIAHAVMAAGTIAKYGSVELKNNYLSAMANGEILGGYALAEPNAALASGPDKVVAVKDGDKYLLNGKKFFVANGGVADVYVVIAQTNEEAGQKGVSAFVVDASEATVVRSVDKLGLRAFPTAEIKFKNAKAVLLGAEEDGVKIMKDIQARADVAFGAVAVGIGQAALEESITHCQNRVQFGNPIGKIQAVQWLLAEMATNIHMMRLAVYKAVNSVQENDNYIYDAAFMKMYVMKAGVDAGMNAVQIHGGIGYSREHNIERYFRDIRGAFNIENVSEYPQKIIAGMLLK
ncbi:acyl-CoA dehydrogenase family protein [Clostridiaceae bacterium 35-E11]